MQQYVYAMVLRNISDCVQTVSLGWTAFFFLFAEHGGLCGCQHTKVLRQHPQLQLNSVRELRKR